MKYPSPQARLPKQFGRRTAFLFVFIVICALLLLSRAVYLQLFNHTFLLSQGNARFTRITPIVAHRGAISDRHGEVLAASTPVDSIWVNPKEVLPAADQIPRLAAALRLDNQILTHRINSSAERDFLYIARQREPADLQEVKNLLIPGVYSSREYRRYYPAGEVTSHILGFTDIDDSGQEGLELAYDRWLTGGNGAKRVIQDRFGNIVQDIESIRASTPGRDLSLSIDMRIQYLAYRELKAAILEHHAKAGSIVILDVTTGEILAMVNQPGYNPNDRGQIDAELYRNRAATDVLEPGSSVKPFFVLAGFASGIYNEKSTIDTSPGFLKLGRTKLEDEHGNLGRATLATILARSSNVGMAKLALSLPSEQTWRTLTLLGLGRVTSSGFPGESAGVLSHYSRWRPIGVATMSRGYGISVTPLQLAHGYATIGAWGIRRPITFLRVNEASSGERVFDAKLCQQLIKLLEGVVAVDGVGTGKKAAIPGYRVAGKTGTAWKAKPGGYASDRFVSVFSGVAPATNPKIAAVVVVDEPSAGLHSGGEVAAPVFSTVVGGALRLLAVPPDDASSNSDDL